MTTAAGRAVAAAVAGARAVAAVAVVVVAVVVVALRGAPVGATTAMTALAVGECAHWPQLSPIKVLAADTGPLLQL
jgi:hypothetical protein